MSIEYMDVIKQLEAERDRIEHAIASLKELVSGQPDTRPTGRFGPMLRDAFLDATPKRPGEGTKTGRVWEICDDLREKHGTVPSLDTVIQRGVAEALNAGTVSSQYRRWRKHFSVNEDLYGVTEREKSISEAGGYRRQIAETVDPDDIDE